MDVSFYVYSDNSFGFCRSRLTVGLKYILSTLFWGKWTKRNPCGSPPVFFLVADLQHVVHKLFQIQRRILKTPHTDPQRPGNICHSAQWGWGCLLLGLGGNTVAYARLLTPCRWRHEGRVRVNWTQLVVGGLLEELKKGGEKVWHGHTTWDGQCSFPPQ